ncbi:hypothetical protein ACFV2X_16605 [Streptomyces sp. NPDC059679]|uniref:hypothetical protein n=1 Tax=Streptomyces sp. NPDC059679 TaxID=3346903 RepID=UPI0036BDC85D
MKRMIRAMVLGASVAAAMVIGGGPAAQAQQPMSYGAADGDGPAVEVQKSDCDSRGGGGDQAIPVGRSVVAKSGSSTCRNISLG